LPSDDVSAARSSRGTRGAALLLDAQFLQRGDDGLVLGELPGLGLGVDFLAVGVDVEDPAAPLDQPRLDSRFTLDEIRQTGGSRQVVSLAAVLDGDLHGSPPRSGTPGI
jgi:hypothetical protein